MKNFFINLLKNILMQILSFSILLGMIAFAITYPSVPSGEVVGGKFMNYFSKILVDTGATTDGKVKNADKLDGYNHTDFIKTETDPTIGTLTAGKWCKYNGITITCVDSAPSTVSGDIIAGCLGTGRYDSSGALGAPTCWGGAIRSSPDGWEGYGPGTCPSGTTIRYIGSTSGPLGDGGYIFLCTKN